MVNRTCASVIIVGGGVTGLSAGWWLAREGIDVLVIDKGIIGWEASGRNGGGCTHYQSPLFQEEQRLWPQMDELLGYPTEHRSERIALALTESQLERYKSRIPKCAEMGFRSSLLSAKEARELVPLAGDNIVGAVHHHFGGHANPQRTVQAYAWALQDHSGRILQHCPVHRILKRGRRVVGIATAQGRISCDHVVAAAGPQTSGLLASLDVDLPTASARVEMIVTEPLPLMPIGGVDGNGLYGRQTLRGNLAYGGGPHEWLDIDALGPVARPSTPLLQSLSPRLVDLFPKAAYVRVIRSWAGIVENTPDGRPVIDRPSELENLTVATMSSVGFGLSPATGRAIRDLVVEGRCAFADLSKLSLARFRGMSVDWRAERGWAPSVSTNLKSAACAPI
jgi:sarcosine oxidase, subunit beta